MPDPLPPNPEPAPALPTREPKIKCEFCDCALTPTGDVFRMSDKARALAKQEESIREIKEQLARLESDLSGARNELADAQKQLAGAGTGRSGGWGKA